MSTRNQPPQPDADGRKQPGRVAIPSFLLDRDAGFLEDVHAGHLSYEQMEAFVDGTLDTQQRRDVVSHVADCRVCAGQLDALSDLAADMQEHAVQPVRVPFRQRLAEWLAMPQIRWAAAAACAALAITLFLPRAEQTSPTGTAAFQSRRAQVIRDGAVRIEVAPDGGVSGAQDYGSYADSVRRAILDPDWRPAATIDPAGTADIAKLQQAHPDEHLLLGIMEAKYGMIADAAQELTKARALNPDSPIVARLLAATEKTRGHL